MAAGSKKKRVGRAGLASVPAAAGPVWPLGRPPLRCFQSKQNFYFSPRCSADFASFGREGYDHENHARHPAVSADRHHFRDLFGRLVNERRILSHPCPGRRGSGCRPWAQARLSWFSRGRGTALTTGLPGINRLPLAPDVKPIIFDFETGRGRITCR
jgi:hypothetical protein